MASRTMPKNELELTSEDQRLVVNTQKQIVWLGRNLDNDIILEGEQVSRQHARIEYRQNQFWLRDSSQNGTYVYFDDGTSQEVYLHNQEIQLVGQGTIVLGRTRDKEDKSCLIQFRCYEKLEKDPAYDEEDTVVLVTSRDAQKKTSPVISESTAYQLLQEYIQDVFALITPEGFIIYYNQAVERLTLRNYTSFVNKDFLSFLHPDDRQDFLAALLMVHHEQQPSTQVTARLCTLNPRWQSFEWCIQPISPSLQALGLNGLIVKGFASDEQRNQDLLGYRYKLIRILNHSTYCTTYLAVDCQRPSHPPCIVKQLHLGKEDPAIVSVSRRLFQAEAATLEKLGKHDRIPFLLAYFEHDQYFYLVQDYIEGENLEEILRNEEWSEIQVTVFLRQLLTILAYVHEQGVIHRDIAPRNIIRRSFDHAFVLIDFGSVKLFANNVLNETYPQKRPLTVVVGTPGYMAPEQAMGQPTYSSDIYSLGVIAIEALARQSYDTIRNTWQSLIADKVDPALIRILAKMTAPVYERYPKALDVLLELNYVSCVQSDVVSEMSQ